MAATVYALATSSALGVDLVAGNSEDGNVLLRNHGGRFERHVLPGGRPDTKAAVVGDLNGDGLDDIIFGGWPNVSLTMLRNDGRGFVAVVLPGMPKHDGSNASWTEALALADVDGDGDLDLLVGNNEEPNYLLRNDGVAGFAPGVPLPGSTTLVTGALAVGDVDGDGHVDVFLGNDEAPNQLLLNEGGGRFRESPHPLPDSGACDLKTKTGHWTKQQCSTRGIALHDVDGDGALDAIIGNYFGDNFLLPNMGNGTFKGPITLSEGNAGYDGTGPTLSVAIGDVDGHGLADVAFGEEGAPNLLVRSNNRSGGFLPAWPLPPVAPCSLPDCPQTDAIALVDLDGDGLLDLVEANYGDPSIWRRNRGHARGFERPTSLPGSASTYTQALAFGSFSERTDSE